MLLAEEVVGEWMLTGRWPTSRPSPWYGTSTCRGSKRDEHLSLVMDEKSSAVGSPQDAVCLCLALQRCC